jgi:hypothetical protein
MSNESKYYTPNANEFRIDFRYELGYLTNEGIGGWEKNVFSIADDQMSLGAIENLIKGGYIRVKVLDEADIVELGWVEKVISVNGGFWNKENWSLNLIFSSGVVRIVYNVDGSNYVYFNGTIRNYNELKDVMRMLEICVG